MPHDQRRLRQRVDFVTSPGYGYPDEQGPAGSAWRQRVGLPRGGPSALITTLALFIFDPQTGEALLQSYHPGTGTNRLAFAPCSRLCGDEAAEQG